ncbi:MAG: response regulator transcription factor [Acidobacteriota bacterium]
MPLRGVTAVYCPSFQKQLADKRPFQREAGTLHPLSHTYRLKFRPLRHRNRLLGIVCIILGLDASRVSCALKEAMKLTPHSPYQLIRILLVDDQAIVREGLRMLLENQAGMRVVSEASTCKQALEAVQREQPDVILLDLDLGASMGSDCLTSLLAASPQSRILVLTGVCDLSLHQTAIRKGAMGLVQKIEAAEVLVKAIRQVHSGEVWLGTTLMTRLLNELWQKNSQPSAEFQPAETAPTVQAQAQHFLRRKSLSHKMRWSKLRC